MTCGGVAVSVRDTPCVRAPQTLLKRKAATRRQGGTMDDVGELGTVTTHTCAWEYLTVVRGRNLLREKGCGLAAINGAAFSRGCTVRVRS